MQTITITPQHFQEDTWTPGSIQHLSDALKGWKVNVIQNDGTTLMNVELKDFQQGYASQGTVGYAWEDGSGSHVHVQKIMAIMVIPQNDDQFLWDMRKPLKAAQEALEEEKQFHLNQARKDMADQLKAQDTFLVATVFQDVVDVAVRQGTGYDQVNQKQLSKLVDHTRYDRNLMA